MFFIVGIGAGYKSGQGQGHTACMHPIDDDEADDGERKPGRASVAEVAPPEALALAEARPP